jgi:hypothetical protein
MKNGTCLSKKSLGKDGYKEEGKGTHHRSMSIYLSSSLYPRDPLREKTDRLSGGFPFLIYNHARDLHNRSMD